MEQTLFLCKPNELNKEIQDKCNAILFVETEDILESTSYLSIIIELGNSKLNGISPIQLIFLIKYRLIIGS